MMIIGNHVHLLFLKSPHSQLCLNSLVLRMTALSPCIVFCVHKMYYPVQLEDLLRQGDIMGCVEVPAGTLGIGSCQ